MDALRSSEKNESSNNDDKNTPPKKQVRKNFTVFDMRGENENGTQSNSNTPGGTQEKAASSKGRQSMARASESEPGYSSSTAPTKSPSRNAISARISRLRRKEYVAGLEKKCQNLKNNCDKHTALAHILRKNVRSLKGQVAFWSKIALQCLDFHENLSVLNFMRVMLDVGLTQLLRHTNVQQNQQNSNFTAQQGHSHNYVQESENPPNFGFNFSTVQNNGNVWHVNYVAPVGNEFVFNANEQIPSNFVFEDEVKVQDEINIQDKINFEDYLSNEDDLNFDPSVFNLPTEQKPVPDFHLAAGNIGLCLNITRMGVFVHWCPMCNVKEKSQASTSDDPSKQQ